MDEQFDNEFKNRIREVFEDFDDASADDGWLKLREKYPEEARRRPFAWIWRGAAAAILLIFFGVGLWMHNLPQKIEKLSGKSSKPAARQHSLAAINDHREAAGHSKRVSGQVAIKPPINNNAITSLNAPGIVYTNKKQTPSQVLPQVVLAGTHDKNLMAATRVADTLKINEKTTPRQQLAIMPQHDPVPVKSKVLSPDSSRVVAQPSSRSMASMLAEEHVLSPHKEAEKYAAYSKRVRFGVYATTYFNYARGSNSQVNGGAGISSDIPLTKNLKLVTGIAVIQNTLNYNSSAIGAGNGIAAAATPSSITDFYLASAGATGANVPKVASYAILAVPTFKNYNASLIGLDIPVNLKYEFNPQKNNLYVAAGVSSGTFVNETYTYQYNSPSFFSASAHKTLGETTARSFNSFYLAKTLNVAFGVGYPFGNHRLVIEPFLKYPLEGLGSQQIRFGAGGVNLKFDFKSLHK